MRFFCASVGIMANRVFATQFYYKQMSSVNNTRPVPPPFPWNAIRTQAPHATAAEANQDPRILNLDDSEEEVETPGDEIVECLLCGCHRATEQFMRWHHKRNHGITANSVEFSVKIPKESASRCPHCQQVMTMQGLQNHIKHKHPAVERKTATKSDMPVHVFLAEQRRLLTPRTPAAPSRTLPSPASDRVRVEGAEALASLSSPESTPTRQPEKKKKKTSGTKRSAVSQTPSNDIEMERRYKSAKYKDEIVVENSKQKVTFSFDRKGSVEMDSDRFIKFAALFGAVVRENLLGEQSSHRRRLGSKK